jgi:Zn-finger nucleic acid-binding protein
MRSVEPRWPCPVCLGVTMKKAPLGEDDGPPYVDHCARCGGIWFEHGEVELVRERAPEELWLYVAHRPEPVSVRCHACHGHTTRATDTCPHCNHTHVIDCPGCAQPMETVAQDGLTLDVCRRCRGVWFDHHELDIIWNRQREVVGQRIRERSRAAGVADAGASALLDPIWLMPDIVFYGVAGAGEGAIRGVAAAGEAAANLAAAGAGAEMASAAAEATAEAASSVFGALLEIVGGIFS